MHAFPTAESRFNEPSKYYANSKTVKLDVMTNDSGLLISNSLAVLEDLFRDGYRYNKAGVTLLGLVSTQNRQLTLFSDLDGIKRSESLMQAIDAVNSRMGRGAIRFGAEGRNHTWSMRQERQTPAYTTCWDDLPRVLA